MVHCGSSPSLRLPDTGIEADFRQPAYSNFGRQTCNNASRLALRRNDFCLYSRSQ
jgi:hypothetical protein